MKGHEITIREYDITEMLGGRPKRYRVHEMLDNGAVVYTMKNSYGADGREAPGWEKGFYRQADRILDALKGKEGA